MDIKAIARDKVLKLKLPIQVEGAAISAVQTGQADGIIAGMSVTDARKEPTSQNHTTQQIRFSV